MLLSGIAKPNFFPGNLTESQHRICKTSLTNVFLRMQSLSNMAVEAGVLLFPSRPKLHVSQLKGLGVQVLGNISIPTKPMG